LTFIFEYDKNFYIRYAIHEKLALFPEKGEMISISDYSHKKKEVYLNKKSN